MVPVAKKRKTKANKEGDILLGYFLEKLMANDGVQDRAKKERM